MGYITMENPHHANDDVIRDAEEIETRKSHCRNLY